MRGLLQCGFAEATPAIRLEGDWHAVDLFSVGYCRRSSRTARVASSAWRPTHRDEGSQPGRILKLTVSDMCRLTLQKAAALFDRIVFLKDQIYARVTSIS